MTTAAEPRSSQHSFAVAENYDPDEVLPRDSPLMTPKLPRLEPSPSPPPDILPAQVSSSPLSIDGHITSDRHKLHPTSGDAVLVAYLGNGRDPEIARLAGSQVLAGDVDSINDESSLDGEPDDALNGGPSLQHLAADALQAFAAAPVTISPSARAAAVDISASTRQLTLDDDMSNAPRAVHRQASGLAPTSTSNFAGSTKIPHAHPHSHSHQPPRVLASPASGELPPLQMMDPSRIDSGGPILPSIHSALGDINRRLPATEPRGAPDKDVSLGHGASGPSFPVSPSAPGSRFSLHGAHGPSPTSPNAPSESYARAGGLPSPHSLPASSPYYFKSNGNGIVYRHPPEYSSSSNAGETPSTDQSGSTPSTSASVNDPMSIDGITNPPQTGTYHCNFAGCNAPPFQTQYLLNSHANVHSSARPHYCPVQGCNRSEGGKGFKRKNEMIRHGLVHDSPGYVCPFCPDREHKYPRPDNLQRHVRVHHNDRDKDDPLLREVLSQRPDGPNRGRRRRAQPS